MNRLGKQHFIGFGATIASAIMFGFLPLLVISICAGGTNTLSCVIMRFSVALPMVLVYLVVKKIPLGLTLREFLDIVLISVFGFGGTSVLLFSSYNYISSGLSTTLHYLYPIIVTMVCLFIFKEKAGKGLFMALGLCFFGVVMFYSGDGVVDTRGILLATASAMTYSFYTIYLGHSSLKGMNDYKVMFYITLVSDIVIFIMATAMNQLDFSITLKAWGIVLLFAFLAAFVGTVGYQIGVKYVGGQYASIISTFEPLTSVVVGATILEEALNFRSVIGIISILTAVIIIGIYGEKFDM